MARSVSGYGGRLVAALASVALVSSARAQTSGLLDSVLDATPTAAHVVADGALGIDEYGPNNAYVFQGGGEGFGGTLGHGSIYMKQDLANLYIGVRLGAPLNDIVCLWLDTRTGGFTDADMDDTADGGRRVSTNLTRDAEDAFEASFRPDFTVVLGSFGIVVFELTAGGPITFLQFSGDFTGTDPTALREIVIPKSTIAMGTSLRFFAGYISDSNFTSDETIPLQPFTGTGNPGFGGDPGLPPVSWSNWNEFGAEAHPGSRWKTRQLDLENDSYGAILADARDYYDHTPSPEFYGPFRRWEVLWTPRSNQVDSPPQRFTYSLTAWAQLLNCPPPFCTGPSVPHSNWRPLGPFSRPQEPTTTATANGVGIVASMWVDPANAAHILLGAELGGLWETTNAGVTWKNLTEKLYLPNLGCRDIVVDPNNSQVIYCLMGFGDFGLGVIKTTDAGTTWACTGLQFSPSLPVTVNRIIHHPTQSGTVYALVGNKIYRTTDGGATWIVFCDPATTCFPNAGVGVLTDIVKDYGANNLWYVASAADYANAIPARIFSLTDNGFTFSCSEITPKTTSNAYFATGGFTIAAAPSQPGKVNAYFVVGGGWGTPKMASTVNAGLSWTVTGSSSLPIAGARIGGLVISPTNPNVMYLAGVYEFQSTDNGLTFNIVSTNSPVSAPNYIHDDVRVQIFRSGTPGTGTSQDVVYVASDGGPWMTTNGGSTWNDISGQGLNIAKFYGLGVSKDRSVDVGGCQDLSTMQYDYFLQAWWNPGRTGDAYETTIDPNNPLIVHSDAFGGIPAMYRSTDGMDTYSFISAPYCSTSGPCSGGNCAPSWNRPVVWDTTGKLYLGNHDLFVSSDSGATWSQLSDFNAAFGIPCGARIRTIAIPASDPTRIYVGFDGPTWGGPPTKHVFRSNNAGATWTDITNDPFTFLSLYGVQWANLTHLEVDPDNGDRVWAAFGDYWGGNRIWYTGNAGATWNNVSAGLPDAPIHDVVYQRCSPDYLYAATDQGVYFWNSAIGQWVCWKDNLPSADVWDLEIHYASNTIVAGTHGRGLWEADLVPAPQSCGCAVPPGAMTLWFPFDEGTGAIANNAVPGNAATHHNGPVAIPGKVGLARFYDPALSQWSDAPAYGSVNIGAGDFSVEGWIRRAGTNPNDGLRVIMDKRAYLSAYVSGYHVWLIDGQLGLQIADNSASYGFNFYSGAYVPLDNQWHQFAVTIDRDNTQGVKFFIDGAPAGSPGDATLRPGNLANNARFTVGAWTGGGGAYFHGGIDELEVFTRALTPAEVSALYTAQSTGKCRSFCQLPAVSVFCPGDSVITVNATICNAGLTPRTFNVWFQGLAGGDGCDVPGPVNFVPFGKFPVTVPAGTCQSVPVQIGLPANLAGATACYIMFIEDPITGDIRSCRGSLLLPNPNLCGGFGGPFWTGLMFQPVDVGPITISSIAPAAIKSPYEIAVVGPDGSDAAQFVRLNGLPPGEPVLGTLVVEPGAVTALKPVSVEFVGGGAHAGYCLVVRADTDNDGVLETIGATQIDLEQPPECPSFADDFESSALGEACTSGSWKPWQREADVCATVVDERAFAGANSLKIVGTPGGATGRGDDTVLQLAGATAGTWTFRCMTFIPADAVGDAAAVLLNTYDDDLAPDPSWYSAQVRFRTGPHLVQADFGAGTTPLVQGQWVELRIEIDLDHDTSNYFYNGVRFVTDRPWTRGVVPGFPGLPRVEAIDLYAGEPSVDGITGMYFDDVSLTPGCAADPPPRCHADWDYNGVVNSTDVSMFINDWFEDINDGTNVTDFDHNGVVNSTDVSNFINSWFEDIANGC
jgi:hypothetical protein